MSEVLTQDHTAAWKARKRVRSHDYRTPDQRALAVAMANKMGVPKAAELLGWPDSTIRLYMRQAEQAAANSSFPELCRTKSDELGAMGYDLAGGALRRLGSRLEKDELSERGLLSLAGLGHNIGKEAFGHGAVPGATVAVQVNVGGEELASRLGAVAERLAQIAAAVPGPCLDVECVVEE